LTRYETYAIMSVKRFVPAITKQETIDKKGRR